MNDLTVGQCAFAFGSACLGIGSIALALAARWMIRRGLSTSLETRWRAYSVLEGDRIVGFEVRWSEPGDDSDQVCVGRYFGEDDSKAGRSLAWAEMAAERHAMRFNIEGRTPFEFDSHRDKRRLHCN